MRSRDIYLLSDAGYISGRARPSHDFAASCRAGIPSRVGQALARGTGYGIILDAPSGEAEVAGLERLVRNVAQLAGRDHRWSAGSPCVGVTPLETDQAAEVLDRARRALEHGERRGGRRVTMADASR